MLTKCGTQTHVKKQDRTEHCCEAWPLHITQVAELVNTARRITTPHLGKFDTEMEAGSWSYSPHSCSGTVDGSDPLVPGQGTPHFRLSNHYI